MYVDMYAFLNHVCLQEELCLVVCAATLLEEFCFFVCTLFNDTLGPAGVGLVSLYKQVGFASSLIIFSPHLYCT